MTTQIFDVNDPAAVAVLQGYNRPMYANGAGLNSIGIMRNARGVWVNSFLTKLEWQTVEREVLDAARLRLNAWGDLQRNNLVKPLSNAMGTLVNQWAVRSEMGPATIAMSPRTRGDNDGTDRRLDGVPIPVILKDFEIDIRLLAASRQGGAPIDTQDARLAGQSVAESIDGMIVNGDTLSFGGQSIYGYRTHPNTVSDTVTNFGGGTWNTITNIVPTISGMIAALSNATVRRHGPYTLYVGPAKYVTLTSEFYSGTDQTTETPLSRIMRIPQIQGVRPLDNLSEDEVLLVQMSGDTVDYLEGMSIQTREWTSPEGAVVFMRVMAIGAPRIRADYNNRLGIAHATGADA